jgi:hypothetical protein
VEEDARGLTFEEMLTVFVVGAVEGRDKEEEEELFVIWSKNRLYEWVMSVVVAEDEDVDESVVVWEAAEREEETLREEDDADEGGD